MGKIIDLLKKWNPWEKELTAGQRREYYLQKIFPYLERKEVLVLKGIRRSGKSTIVKQLITELLAKGTDKKQILYLNLEDLGFADTLTVSLFDNVLKEYLVFTNNKNKIYFFIDEIQKIPSWEKWIRTQYDLEEHIKFIITGSSASLLSKELSTLLTGRNISFVITPFSFKEFMLFNPEGSLEKYMTYGGFPEVVLEKDVEKKETLLQQYFEDIIHKDIIDRYSIRNTKQLMDLARYVISSSGSKVSINKLSKIFGIAKETLQTYLSYMIDAYLLYEVPFFSFSLKIRHDVSKLSKFYCLDSGLVHVTNTTYGKNRSQKFETAAIIKLFQEYRDVCYWGSADAEVDFIVDQKAINVTATDNIPEREWHGLHEFQKKHKQFSLLLVVPSLKKESVIPLEEFLNSD